jgi:hypothetical protein
MRKKLEPKIPTSFRMSKTAYDLMQRLADHMGLGRGAVLELAIRTLAREQGVK